MGLAQPVGPLLNILLEPRQQFEDETWDLLHLLAPSSISSSNLDNSSKMRRGTCSICWPPPPHPPLSMYLLGWQYSATYLCIYLVGSILPHIYVSTWLAVFCHTSMYLLGWQYSATHLCIYLVGSILPHIYVSTWLAVFCHTSMYLLGWQYSATHLCIYLAGSILPHIYASTWLAVFCHTSMFLFGWQYSATHLCIYLVGSILPHIYVVGSILQYSAALPDPSCSFLPDVHFELHHLGEQRMWLMT